MAAPWAALQALLCSEDGQLAPADSLAAALRAGGASEAQDAAVAGALALDTGAAPPAGGPLGHFRRELLRLWKGDGHFAPRLGAAAALLSQMVRSLRLFF
jgi:hypothetical protein